MSLQKIPLHQIDKPVTAGSKLLRFNSDTNTIEWASGNTANWDTAFGWGDHSGKYLALAGGTVTGNVTLSGAATLSGTVSFSQTPKVSNVDISLVGHSHDFSALTNKPTTLSGFGITDAFHTKYMLSEILGATPVDMNTYHPSGGLVANYYGYPSWTNVPTSMYGMVQTLQAGASSVISVQTAYDIRHGNTDYANMFIRTKNASGWNTWRKVWHDGNLANPGTVTSVALSLPSMFTVTGSPLTTTGTLTATLANQNANLVFAGPTSGGAAAPTFRSLVLADIPSVDHIRGGSTTNLNTVSSVDDHLTYQRYSSSATNSPPGGVDNANGVLTLKSHPNGGTGGYAKQIAFGNHDDLYIRRLSDGTFYTWRKVWHDGNLTNLNQLTTRNFSDLNSKPTTLAGYGITDAASSTHSHTFASLTSVPTTLAGYGITDAVALRTSANTFTAANTFSSTVNINGVLTSGLVQASSVIASDVIAIFKNSASTASGDLTQWVKNTTTVAKVTADGNVDATKFTQAGVQQFVDTSYLSPSTMIGVYDVPETEKVKLRDPNNWNLNGIYIGEPIVSTFQGQHLGEPEVDIYYEYICRGNNVWRRIPLS